MGGGAIGRTGRERLLELAHRNGGVARSHRHAAESGVARRVERIDLDNPIVGKGERWARRWPSRQARPAGAPRRWRCDRCASRALILLDGARLVAQLLGKATHDGVRAVGAGRHRHERRRLLERFEGRLVALLGERRAERELRAIAARPFRRRRLQGGKVAALPLVSRAAWFGRLRDVPQRRPDGAEPRVEHLVERRLQLVDRDAKSLANRGVALGAVAVDADQRVAAPPRRAWRRCVRRAATPGSTRARSCPAW